MAAPKAKSRPVACEDTTIGQDEDDFSTGSSSESTGSSLGDTTNAASTVHPLFSLGGWFEQSPTPRSRASRGKNSVDESSQDEDGTMGDFSTVDHASVDSSVSGDETHLVTAAQSVIISLSYSGPDSDRSDEETASRSRRGSIRHRGGSSAHGRHQKGYRDTSFKGRHVMKVTTNIAADTLGLQDESRDPGDNKNSAADTASRDDVSYGIANATKRSAQSISIPSKERDYRPIRATDAPTACGDTVISTPSKAQAFFEQDDATADRLSTHKSSWFGFGWFASPSNDPSRNQEGPSYAATEPLPLVTVPKSEQSTIPEVTRHVKVEERKASRLVEECGCSDAEEIEVSNIGPILSEAPIDKSLTPKARLGSFRGLFSLKKGKPTVGMSRVDKDDEGYDEADDPDLIFVRVTETTGDNQVSDVDGLGATNNVPSVGAVEQKDHLPIVPTPIKEEKSDAVTRSLSRETTPTTSNKPSEKKAMIPLSLPRPRKVGTKPIQSKVVTKATNSLVETGKSCEISSKIPADLPKADTSLKSAPTKMSINRRKKFGRWGRDHTRQIGKTPSSCLRTGSDLPTIDEEAKDHSFPVGVLGTDNEMRVGERFQPAQQTKVLDAAAGESRLVTTNGTIPVQTSNSSISFQSGRSSTSKISRASKVSIASGHSEETIKRKNRGILRRLLLNKSRQETTSDHGELSDLITQYKEKKNMTGHDGPKTVSFFLEKKNKLVFSSLSEEKRALRAMNLAVAQRLQEIDEMQRTQTEEPCGASLCLCG